MLRRFWNDESGMETVEYAVMAALIVVALIVAIQGVETAVEGKFTELASVITGG